VNLLRPFVITAAHSGKEDLADLDPAVREIFASSDLSTDPNRLNVFMFVLNPQGRVVHEFHGVPGRERSGSADRSDHLAEIRNARAKLRLPEVSAQKTDGALKGLPDLEARDSAVPTGVRLFIRQDEPGNSVFSTIPVVEVVPMSADDWHPLAFAPQQREIAAEVLKSWLVWLYPAGIRAADEQKRFQKFSGTLKFAPAGTDGMFRYAMLRGKIHLTKADDTESEFDGELEAVLTYPQDTAGVHSVRAVVDGTYLYRTRGTSREVLKAAIESRPE